MICLITSSITNNRLLQFTLLWSARFINEKTSVYTNCDTRLVMKQRIPACGIDRALVNLHWLKGRFRCIVKLLVIVYNCLHDIAPVKIMSLLQYGDSKRTKNLRETKCCNKVGVKVFSHAGPKMRNLLPKSIRDIEKTVDFKKALKTFLITRGNEYYSYLSRKRYFLLL